MAFSSNLFSAPGWQLLSDTDDIDAFAVRCKDTNPLYWVPVVSAEKKNTDLRVKSLAIDHPSVSLAAEFTFDAMLSGS